MKEVKRVVNKEDLILEELKAQSAWLRILGIQSIRDLVKETMKEKQDKEIYELSNGRVSTREIAKRVGSSHVKVASRWKEWASLGLVIPSETFKGRFKKVISLRDLGM